MFEERESFVPPAYGGAFESPYEPATEVGWVDGDLLCLDYHVDVSQPDITDETGLVAYAFAPLETNTLLDPDVYAMTEHGIAIAETLAAAPEFNNNAAEMTLRPLAALFNGADGLNGAALAQLPPAEVLQLRNAARTAHGVLGDRLRERVAFSLAAQSPMTEADTQAFMIGAVCNTVQGTLRAGPQSKHGYDPSKETAMRALVVQLARAFAGIYRGLSVAGHPKANDPSHRYYVASTIMAATPESMRPDVEYPETPWDEATDYI